MWWSLNIGRIAGTVIRVHVTFVLLLVWVFLSGYALGGIGAAWSELAFAVLLFACVLAHEFGHIFTARLFSVSTPDVTLLPIGGVARLERIPEVPYQEFLIAVAGPAVNIVIALALMLLAGVKFDAAHLAAINSTETSLVDRLAAFNIFVAAFNIIPAFPMDGGRVLRAALAARLGFVRATEIAAVVGQWLAFGLGFLGLFYNPILIFIAVFVYLGAASEAQLVALRAASRGMPVSAAMITRFASLVPKAHIDQAVETLLQTSQSEFPVTDAHGRLLGLLGRNQMIAALKEKGPDTPVSEAMATGIPTIDQSRCLEDAFRLLQEKSAPAVGVVDNDGRLVGLITAETVGEMLMLSHAMPEGVRLRARESIKQRPS